MLNPFPSGWQGRALASRPASPSGQGYECSGRGGTLGRGYCSATRPLRNRSLPRVDAPFTLDTFGMRNGGVLLRRLVLRPRRYRPRSGRRWRPLLGGVPDSLTGTRCPRVRYHRVAPRRRSGLRPSSSECGNGLQRLRGRRGLQLHPLVRRRSPALCPMNRRPRFSVSGYRHMSVMNLRPNGRSLGPSTWPRGPLALIRGPPSPRTSAESTTPRTWP